MKTAVVTGASRGIGRGVSVALARRGYRLCVSGRSAEHLRTLKAEAELLGAECHTFVCDHNDAQATEACFADIAARFDVDLIVNNAWGGYYSMLADTTWTWNKGFWNQSLERWASMMDVGVRTVFLCSKHCVKPMLEKKSGTIVNISFWAARRYMDNAIYGTSKAAVDTLSRDMAHELREHGVAALSLYPGLVRTEGVLENAAYFDMSNSESPEFVGMVIDALARDPKTMERSGGFFTTAELAEVYGIVDIDGKKIQDNRLA